MNATHSVLRITGIHDPNFHGQVLDLGPAHPASAGLLEARVSIQDDRVTAIDVQPGALHRGVEMILPTRDYRQGLSLANRHDWQAPFFGEWALARLVEDALGVEVPPRALWVRGILAEHSRIASHLAYLSFVGFRLGDPGLDTGPVREELRLRMAELTGNRVHPMAVRLGGVACAPEGTWASTERETVRRAAALADRIGEALSRGLGQGVATLTRQAVDAHGLAGPVARASGVDTDLRRGLTPWAQAEDLLTVDAPTSGDAAARLAHLAAEVTASAAWVDRFLDGLPDGPLEAHLPKVVKLPEGDWTSAVEAPLGRAGMVVTSRGDKTPRRLRLRTASWANVSAWSSVLPGTPLTHLPTAMASLPWVAGDLDK